MKHIEKIIALIILVGAIGFNLWLYRAEPTILVDPNDNAFQYALVERTNIIWEYIEDQCNNNHSSLCILHYALLFDHWVPNWAEGYNLPYYYSHIPQIVLVGTYKLSEPVTSYALRVYNYFNPSPVTYHPITLFEYYHWIIYLLLCLFPLSVFLALKIIKQSWFTAGIGAFLSVFLSTDGLYGLDPSSFLWRGWGLSSQLFAMIWMPLAIASIIRYMMNDQRSKKSTFSFFILSILFITLTTMGHLGMGMMLFLAIPIITFTKPVLTLLKNQSANWRMSRKEFKHACIQTALLAIPPLLLLSYWILPTLLNSQYHNISFWDPLWKFNSYGIQEILVNLSNGNLFDFGRLPIITGLVFIGFFVCLLNRQGQKTCLPAGKAMSEGQQNMSHAHCPMSFELSTLSFLFLFFLFLYFGSTTWGPLMNLIPGMKDFHQHRFIVGIHLIGLFLAPIGFMWMIDGVMRHGIRVAGSIQKHVTRHTQLKNKMPYTTFLFLCLYAFMPLCLFFLLSPQTIKYGTYNEELIQKANAAYLTQKPDADLLMETLRTLPPGRIYAGRGGGWGKDFRISQTSYFMYLSTYGFPTVLWLPQTWSLNSDTEQYFSEDVPSHYELYNIRYVVAPVNVTPQKFWTLIKESATWKLYGIEQTKTSDNKQETEQYITVGVAPTVVFSDKQSFTNVVRLWIQSDYPKKQLFPELRIKKTRDNKQETKTLLPHFTMLDEATYGTPDGKTHSLFGEPPLYMTPWEYPQAFPTMTNDQLPITNYKLNPSAMRNPQSDILPISITSQSSDHDMVFRATVKVSPLPAEASSEGGCPTCVVVLKQTYHPNWNATVNGKPVETIQVFPAFTAIRLEQKGTYDIIFSYTPSSQKMILLTCSILGILVSLGVYIVFKYRQ